VQEQADHERARELADALLEANQLDRRAQLQGAYSAGEGVYEMDYRDSLSAGRFVVSVWLEEGRAELQRQ
jgi:hypothetical protein